MNDLRKAAEMALKTLENERLKKDEHLLAVVEEALREALAQPEQEPVAWYFAGSNTELPSVALDEELDARQKTNCIPLYTAPPKREWVGLTRRELDIATLGLEDLGDCYKAIEAKLKEKNCVL